MILLDQFHIQFVIPAHAGIHIHNLAPVRVSMKTYFVYIMASKKNGTLYIGVTSNIKRRVWQHKNDVHDGFTKKYGIHRLVWYEMTDHIGWAIQREKQMKKWRRQWKIDLIEEKNPNWTDLYEELF